MKRVLIVQYSSALDGSAYSGLMLADGLKEADWETHVAFGFDGSIIPRYRENGHIPHIIEHKNWLRRKNVTRFLKDVFMEWEKADSFVPLIRKINPDLIYLNTTVSLAGAIAANSAHIPSIWHLREIFDDCGGEMRAPRWAKPIVRKFILNHSAELIANSRFTVSNFLGKSALKRVKIVPNAVEERFFVNDKTKEEARSVFNFPNQTIIIGVPGTLRPMKGHLFFFNSIAPLLKKYQNILVAVTGTGSSEYIQQIQYQLKSLSIDSKVRFLNSVSDMHSFYRACDFVCVPSRVESFGRTIIESFASMTPVIATSVGAIREIIKDKYTGRLIPFGDQIGLRKIVVDLIEHEEIRQKISKRARQVAEAKYHEKFYKAHLVDIANSITE